MNKGLHPKPHEKQFLHKGYEYIMVWKVRKDLLQNAKKDSKITQFPASLQVYSI